MPYIINNININTIYYIDNIVYIHYSGIIYLYFINKRK
jgi:hypothetical protein